MYHHRGFTLLETMISLTLGLLLFIGLLETFTSAKTAYRYLTGMAFIEENGQLASYLLTQEIAQTGYIGCRKADTSFPLKVHTLSATNNLNFIQGYTSNNLPADIKKITHEILPGNLLAIQFMSNQTTTLTAAIKSHYVLNLNDANFFEASDLVMISDCLHADLIKIARAYGTTITSLAQVNDYAAGAQLGLWKNEWFYIADTGRVNQAGQKVAALYLSQPNGRDEELVDNIEKMQIQYGYLNSRKELKFFSTANLNWVNVKAVKIYLLLSSSEPILPSAQTISFNGTTQIAPDKKLYRTWEIIIPLLNR